MKSAALLILLVVSHFAAIASGALGAGPGIRGIGPEATSYRFPHPGLLLASCIEERRTDIHRKWLRRCPLRRRNPDTPARLGSAEGKLRRAGGLGA